MNLQLTKEVQGICASLFLVILSSVGLLMGKGAEAQALDQRIPLSTVHEKDDPMLTRLIGRWTVASDSGRVMDIIFTSDYRMFMIKSSTEAVQFSFKFNSDTQPYSLDFQAGNDFKISTILRLNSDKSMDIGKMDVDEPRPTSFRSDKITYRKFSSSTSLPPGVVVIDQSGYLSSQVKKSRQLKAKVNIVYINRSQQAFFLENMKFANRFNQLGEDAKRVEDLSLNSVYKYSIKNLGPNVSQVTAIPRTDDLKVYSGFVWRRPSNIDEISTLAKLCESQKIIHQEPTISGGHIHCPDGSRAIE